MLSGLWGREWGVTTPGGVAKAARGAARELGLVDPRGRNVNQDNTGPVLMVHIAVVGTHAVRRTP